jgi:nucleoredoxin
MKDKELVLLYFSASWCPPCKAFSPMLKKFYAACAQDEKIEIVYISSDRTVEDFNGYYRLMPWLAIPTEQGSAAIKGNLAQNFGIMGIPTLVVIDAKTGEFITNSAREHVAKTNGNASSAKAVVKDWKASERKPLSEASAGIGGSPIAKVISFFARHPMYIVGILYLYKWAMKKIKTLTAEYGGEGETK